MIKKKTNYNLALTLIETLVVISIIGILVSISVFSFRTYNPTLKLNGSIRNLTSDLRYAQQLAVAEQIEHSVYFIAAEKKYQIKKYGPTISIVKEVILPEEIIEITVSGLTIADSNKEAKYNPYGAVADSGIITLKNSKNNTKSVDIRPSGFVKISD